MLAYAVKPGIDGTEIRAALAESEAADDRVMVALDAHQEAVNAVYATVPQTRDGALALIDVFREDQDLESDEAVAVLDCWRLTSRPSRSRRGATSGARWIGSRRSPEAAPRASQGPRRAGAVLRCWAETRKRPRRRLLETDEAASRGFKAMGGSAQARGEES